MNTFPPSNPVPNEIFPPLPLEGICPNCNNPRPWPIYEDEPDVFLPGSICEDCGHVEDDIEAETDDEIVVMDRDGTLTHVDGADYTTVIAITESEWDAFAEPLKVDKWLVQAAINSHRND